MIAMPPSGDASRSHFDRWMDIYEAAYQDPGGLSSSACPSCGERALAMVFVVERVGESRAIVAFWCGHCHRGLPANTTTVPPGASATVRGTETIPNYNLVPDDA